MVFMHAVYIFYVQYHILHPVKLKQTIVYRIVFASNGLYTMFLKSVLVHSVYFLTYGVETLTWTKMNISRLQAMNKTFLQTTTNRN